MSEEFNSSAVISSCETYRYELRRRWAYGIELGFLMINPSTATAEVNDATIRRCIGFARRESYGAIRVVNLYAYRDRSPKNMQDSYEAGIPIVGDENDAYILSASKECGKLIAAWGAQVEKIGHYRRRIDHVRGILEGRPLHCLGYTRDGHPRHPLMLSRETPLELFESRQS